MDIERNLGDLNQKVIRIDRKIAEYKIIIDKREKEIEYLHNLIKLLTILATMCSIIIGLYFVLR